MIWVRVMIDGGKVGKLPAEGRPGLAGLSGAGSLVQEFGAILRGDFVVDRAMRSDGVVFVAEAAGDNLRFEHAAEQFAIEAFVAEAAVEAFVHAVLPRTAWFDEACGDARVLQPGLEGAGGKLTAVVAAQMPGRSVTAAGRLQRRHHGPCAELATGPTTAMQ